MLKSGSNPDSDAAGGAKLAAVYEFSGFRLDCDRFELNRNGLPLRVERKPMELLMLLLSRRGKLVSRQEIAEHLWSSEIFVDTEHGINTAVRKLRYLLQDDAEESRFIQTVTGKGYRFIAPVTVIEMAVPEVAPVPVTPMAVAGEGRAKDAERRRVLAGGEKRSARGSAEVRRWLWMAAAFVALAAGVSGFRWYRSERESSAITSVAVLPLENLSGDASQEYFADGMTDELITMLAKDSTLRIPSRTSAMQYKGVRKPLPEIARALHVDGVLEGSVSRTGKQVHMTLQLIRAENDAHVWAESYDRGITDTNLPREAAQAIAKRLHSETGMMTIVSRVDPAAHDAFLQGRYLWFTDKVLESGPYFRKATEIQPDYAQGWAWLAAYYGEAIAAGLLDPKTNGQPMWDAAQKAMQLNPELADAHWAMGGAYLLRLWDWKNAESEFRQAIKMDPGNAEYYYVFACVLSLENRYDEAIAAEKKQMELDPFERPAGLATIYMLARRYDEALKEIELRKVGSASNLDLMGMEWEIWRRKGDYAKASACGEKFFRVTGDLKTGAEFRRAYEKGGERGVVLWWLKRDSNGKGYRPRSDVANLYAQLGDKDKALTLLEQGYRQHEADTRWIQQDPSFDFLHGEPRYRAIVEKMGLPRAY